MKVNKSATAQYLIEVKFFLKDPLLNICVREQLYKYRVNVLQKTVEDTKKKEV